MRCWPQAEEDGFRAAGDGFELAGIVGKSLLVSQFIDYTNSDGACSHALLGFFGGFGYETLHA